MTVEPVAPATGEIIATYQDMVRGQAEDAVEGAHRPAECGIAIMAKASVPGRAKTRLVPPLSVEEAAAFNTAFLQDVAEILLAAGREGQIASYTAYGPPGSEDFFRRKMPEQIGLIEVWYPYFGDCLRVAVCELLRRGHGTAILLNSDSPTLPTALLVEAMEALAQPGDRAVLGPAEDGGYYLIGLKHAHKRLFEDIVWSGEHVAHQTVERAVEIGLPVHVLPTWYDVDSIQALRVLHAELNEGYSFDPALRPSHAAHTAALMESLLATSDLAARIGITRPAAPHGIAV